MWFFNKVGCSYKVIDTISEYKETDGNDFESMANLKQSVKRYFNEVFSCPNCGSKNISGDNIIVEVGKVRLCRLEDEKGWFGKVNSREIHLKDVYRIYDISPNKGGFLSGPAGRIECKSCGAGKREIVWMSINDVMNKFGRT